MSLNGSDPSTATGPQKCAPSGMGYFLVTFMGSRILTATSGFLASASDWLSPSRTSYLMIKAFVFVE